MDVLGILKKVFMVFLVILLLLELPALILSLSLYSFALDGNTYKNALERGNAYDNAYVFLEQMQKNSSSIPIDLKQVVTKEWMREQAGLVIDQAFAYVKGESQSSNIYVSLAEPKSKLKAMLPPGAEARLPNIPENVDLTGQFNLKQPLDQVRQYAGLAGLAVLGLFILTAGLLGILALCAWKLKSILRWLGFPLFVSGGFCLLSALALPSVVQGSLPPASDQVGVVVMPIVAALVGEFTGRLMLVSGIVFVLGLVMLAASFMVKKQEDAAQPKI